MKALVDLMTDLARWVNNGSRETVDRSAKELAEGYRKQIQEGKNADHSQMAPLKRATLENPIRRGLSQGEAIPTVRKSLGDTPLHATGKTAESIKAKKVATDTWEIAPDTKQAQIILNSNAKTSHSGYPFMGDTPKAVRDPLQVSDKQLDLLENNIVKDLERALGI